MGSKRWDKDIQKITNQKDKERKETKTAGRKKEKMQSACSKWDVVNLFYLLSVKYFSLWHFSLR